MVHLDARGSKGSQAAGALLAALVLNPTAVTSGQEETSRRRAVSPLSPVCSASNNGLEDTVKEWE